MSQALLLLATFLAVVVVGGTLVALHDAVERLWQSRRSPRSIPRSGSATSRARPAGTPVVSWRHLH